VKLPTATKIHGEMLTLARKKTARNRINTKDRGIRHE
jgi:hypothetical protein